MSQFTVNDNPHISFISDCTLSVSLLYKLVRKCDTYLTYMHMKHVVTGNHYLMWS